MKITYNGNEYEAYPLLMRKENALEILNGTKRVEIRSYSQFYFDKFVDPEQAAINRKVNEGELDESHWKNPIRRDTACIHFYSTGAPWTLDVSMDNIGIASMCEEDIKWLNEEYDFHDFDEEWKKYEGLPDDEVPLFFYLGIEKILNHEGLAD